MKVMTIVGTRPEIIKLSRVMAALDLHTEHVLVHTGQNYDYELNELFFKDLEIRKPDHYLSAAGETAIETIANVIVKADQLFEKVKPDAVLLYGDTNSCLSGTPANLVSYWNIEESSGQFMHDVGANGHHAYLGASFFVDGEDPGFSGGSCLAACCGVTAGFVASDNNPRVYQNVNFTNRFFFSFRNSEFSQF